MIEAAVVNSFEDVLRQCGVAETTLAPDEKDSLDRHGYVMLPDIMDADWLALLREAFERAIGPRQGKATGQQSGTRHVDDLAWKVAAFDGICTHSKVLAAVYHVLRRPFILLHMSGRDPLPKYGQQGLHTDWVPRSATEPFYAVTALWLLDDFTPNNGATRLIPGSHLITRPLPKPMQQPESRHPDQRLIIGKAGAVLVFNGHLWHSGTRNEASRPRRVLQCQFIAREVARPTDTRPRIPEDLTPVARYILGV